MKLFPYPQENHIAYMMLCMTQVPLCLLDAKHLKKFPCIDLIFQIIYKKAWLRNSSSAMVLVEQV